MWGFGATYIGSLTVCKVLRRFAIFSAPIDPCGLFIHILQDCFTGRDYRTIFECLCNKCNHLRSNPSPVTGEFLAQKGQSRGKCFRLTTSSWSAESLCDIRWVSHFILRFSCPCLRYYNKKTNKVVDLPSLDVPTEIITKTLHYPQCLSILMKNFNCS